MVAATAAAREELGEDSAACGSHNNRVAMFPRRASAGAQGLGWQQGIPRKPVGGKRQQRQRLPAWLPPLLPEPRRPGSPGG
ncbi:hypothetical protein Cadr_000024362 [Camelus dromedarius]|uniref:Uncharacterized protein n=1 Tax=Camelus dromedarius TaxID=9838 RepID=A0A5N4CQT3_CAMDR|nr:hypothetical protein Cadr_000024362 [Camelus dromedarius]